MSNFESIRRDKRYYVDKTAYIEKLEEVKNPVFLRPRRFGKTLFAETLRYYYDIKAAHKFEELFGDLYIGKNPTPKHNTYFFIKFDFSGMGVWTEGDPNYIKKQFDKSNLITLEFFLRYYKNELNISDDYIQMFREFNKNDCSTGLKDIISLVAAVSGKLFIAIDEYDSLTNAMAIYYKDASDEENEYLNILKKGGFFRGFFETIKHGTATAVDQVYITGILPITIADMNSGFNIASWITFDHRFTNMLGITHSEFENLFDTVCNDHNITLDKQLVRDVVYRYYDGYRFLQNGDLLFNPMMTMYILEQLIHFNRFPEDMVDRNLKIDYNQIAYIFGNNIEKRNEVITSITDKKQYDFRSSLSISFTMGSYRNGEFITEGLYYSGILTFSDKPDMLKIPNLVTYEFVLQYFKEIMNYKTDSNLITKITNEYAFEGDAEKLIEKFFTMVIQKFPGDFFKNVNESYYHGLLFYVLWNAFSKDRYEVFPEFQVTNGKPDIMFRTLTDAIVSKEIHDLFELKCVPKSANEKVFTSKFDEAKNDIENYCTGDYKDWRGIAVCFRGNLDYKISVKQ